MATTQHRVLAAAIDSGIVLTAFAAALAIFFVAGHGELPQNMWSGAALAILGVVLTALYQTFWVLANGDSAGLRWARLKLVNFDGRRPSRRERTVRMFSGWLSVLPAGLGLLWALMDEESLTWHDQISKTFPSPLDALK